MKLYEGECDYRTELGIKAHCQLKVYRTLAGVVAVATEDRNNPGTCITYRAEALASQVLRTYGDDPEHFAWVEHWEWRPGCDETFDRVSFHWDPNQWDGSHRGGFSMPHWTRIDRETVDHMIGEPLEAREARSAA